MELMLPERLNSAAMLRFLGDGFDIASDVMTGGDRIDAAARRAGYGLALAEQMTPSLRLDSYVHDHDDQRLILNTHVYPGFVRKVLNLMLPGGVEFRDLEAFRTARAIAGETYDWRGHIYGEWLMTGPSTLGARGDATYAIFVEIRQDQLQGEPYLLRTMFHHIGRAPDA
jgi:hypothetical protein